MVSAQAGKAFELRLGSGPTTGYKWEVAPPSGVRLVKEAFERSAGAALGDGGEQVFRLLADAPGRHRLEFRLRRPWEPDPIETRVVEVDVI